MPDLHSRDDTRHWVKDVLFAEAEVVIATDGSELIGFVARDTAGKVRQLQVAEDWRGQGIGSRLLASVAHKGAAELSLWCFQANSAALRFYAREGFREVERTKGDNAEGLPDVLLVLRKTT